MALRGRREARGPNVDPDSSVLLVWKYLSHAVSLLPTSYIESIDRVFRNSRDRKADRLLPQQMPLIISVRGDSPDVRERV